ncbi:MAG: hypothetical protein JWP12_2151 [Bacteroidetes bacterium]|nr:hypothetical protein [Bacteroidota bacterium]
MIRTKILFAAFLLFLQTLLQAQNPYVDSLKIIIVSTKHDTVKLHAYTELVYEYTADDIDSALYFGSVALKKYETNKNQLLVSDLYSALGAAYGYKRDFDNSLLYYQKSLAILKTGTDQAAIAKSYYDIGLVYYYTSKFEPAIQQFLEALKMFEAAKDPKMLPSVYNGLGGIYKDMQNYNDALKYFNKGLVVATANKDTLKMGSCYNNIGSVYDYQDKYDLAIANYTKALEFKKAAHSKRGLPSTLNNIGIVLSKQDKTDEALSYYNQSLEYSIPGQDLLSQTVSYDGMGMVYYKKKQYDQALQYLEKSVALAAQVGSQIDLVSSYEKIALCYGAKGNYKKAYDYQQLLLKTKDSVLNSENSMQINEMSAKYESEKKQLQIENLNKDNALKLDEINKQELRSRQQIMLIVFIAIALVLVSVLTFFIFRGYRIKQRSNEIITGQKKEVELQRDLIEAKNIEITDSIFYARRIQRALLASDALLKKNLPEYFVMYKPKDIVSGDFYWANTVNDKFYLSVADCTGHGVPGAFMSLLNISFLNETVIEKKIESPDKILEQVRTQIITALNPEGVETESKDGMDAVVCMFDFKSMWLRFACANNPLWLIRNNEIKEFAADKMPVGMHYGEQKPFTLQTLGLRKGDLIYLFTDGYADQFGGEGGKKFKYKQLKQLLLDNHQKSLAEQKIMLETTLAKWQGGLEQLDDILIVGIKV